MMKPLLIFCLTLILSVPRAAWADQQTIAELNGEPISSDQVESRAATKLYRLRWEIYETLKTEAQALVDERLLEEEAKKRGLSTEELLRQEVDEKSVPATDADIDAYIKEHNVKETGEEARNRLRTYLTDRARIQRKLDFQEALRKKANYKFFIEEPERPRMQVSVEGCPARGAADAPVTIIEFSSFSCEHCADSSRKVQRLTEEFPGTIRLVHRDFLNMFDERGLSAAEAGRTAAAQGKFWEFHDYIYSLSGDFKDEDLPKILSTVGVDPAPYEQAHEQASYIMGIKHDIEDGVDAGVTSVPALFINGRYISGTFPYERLRQMVAEELHLPAQEVQKVSTSARKQEAGK